MLRIRKQIEEEEIIRQEEDRMKALKKKSYTRRAGQEQVELARKAMGPVKVIDKCIVFQDPNDEEMLGFYFDKFNFNKKDVNPFIKNTGTMLDHMNDQYSVRDKNLSRRVLTNRHSQKRIEKMNELIQSNEKAYQSIVGEKKHRNHRKAASTMEFNDYKDQSLSRSPIKANHAGRIMIQNSESNLSIKYTTKQPHSDFKRFSQNVLEKQNPDLKDKPEPHEQSMARMKLKLNTSSAVSFTGLNSTERTKPAGFTNLLKRQLPQMPNLENNSTSRTFHQQSNTAASVRASREKLASTEIKHRYLNFKDDLTKQETISKRQDKRANRIVRRLREQLQTQKVMVQQIDIYGAPTDIQKDGYFNKKIKNYYEAMRMENSVSNYEIDQILNGGGIHQTKRK
ncbi:hypothetical protein FGO68_gene15494 [Halteria grandinella]|uniref:Uncharacterized protein n=1 Tax=Halteria grandinella TaxID=5974 RepID=A0A8J8TA56_HALGN|nr:hypothetical protein FGO68_gene15494 [Halteria grandinella]